jgi:ABC-type Co2+ transport system permease subunit
MKTIIENIQAWFLSKGGFTHICAGLFLAAVGAFGAVPAFHTLCMNLYHVLPAWAEQVILAAIGIYAWYRVSRSPAGTVAAAKAIMKDTATAPTAAEISAATTSK